MRIIFAITLLLANPAFARVFNVNETSLATYFRGNYGISQLKDDSYGKSSGSQTTFSDEAQFNWGGELGFAFPSKDYTFRVGIEVIAPSLASDMKGNNSSGTQLMTLDSSVYGFFPVVHFEYYISRTPFGRAFVSFGGGYGKVSMKNEYTFTTDGDTAYSPLTSFTEKASQYTYMLETAIGFEMSFVQAVTFIVDVGYRYSVARELEYDGAGSDFNGGHNEGDPVLNSDGTHRSLDLGGVFTGLSFRFYFN